ncbi:hypothetical protein R5R35_001316 [Gryllus longicercus]|uniref:Galactose mutarotase n=1 Tax=Gryllus longicercus TaxID=2509291 RepID=A0AAN9YY82_9ORTH|nr:Aldose 1-epimerase [Gryllus bimaculatus]
MRTMSVLPADKKCGKHGWRYRRDVDTLIILKLSMLFFSLNGNNVSSENIGGEVTKNLTLSLCRSNSNTTYSGVMDEAGDSSGVELVEDGFGFLVVEGQDGNTCSEIVRRFTMTNQNGMTVQIITYGGIITSIQVPDRNGEVDDVVLGFDSMLGYLGEKNPYFGAIVGRVANRIRDGKFKIGNQEYKTTQNRGGLTLHGGLKGFDKKLWESHVQGSKLTLSYLSSDGEEGFPGTLLTHVTYQLTPLNELIVEVKATTTKPTPVNIAGHSYFNLAGHSSGSEGLLQHHVSINADQYTVTDYSSVPTGEIKDVLGTHMDLRVPRLLKEVLPLIPGLGFDNNFCVKKAAEGEMNFVASVKHPGTGRVLDVFSNQPGVQFYTANYLPDPNASEDEKLRGKEGVPYEKWGGLCLETQNYPDAVNNPNFPDSILIPGKEYFHRFVYRFGISD